MKWCIYAVLIAPFRTVLTPSMFLTHWAFLSLLIFSSWMRALSLFLASCLFPTPAWWILPKRHSTWALIAANDSLLLICPTISAFSWSLPPSGLPSASTWKLSLDSAMVSIKSWTSWLASPNAPKQRRTYCVVFITFSNFWCKTRVSVGQAKSMQKWYFLG